MSEENVQVNTANPDKYTKAANKIISDVLHNMLDPLETGYNMILATKREVAQ